MIPAPHVARFLILTSIVVLVGCQVPGQTVGGPSAPRSAAPGTTLSREPGPVGKPMPPPDQPAPWPSAAPLPALSPATPLPAPSALPSGEGDVGAPPSPAASTSPASAAPTASASTVVGETPTPAASAASPTPAPTPQPSPLPRTTTDRPDDEAGYQVHVVYAVPQDGEDRGYDTDGTISRSVYAFDDWLYRKSKRQRVRLDRSGGAVDISYVRLAGTDAALAANRRRLRDALERELRVLGFTHPQKMYAVYYDGTNPEVCGGAPWPPSVPGTVAALYLKGTPDCDSTGWTSDGVEMTYREFAMLHEIVHGLGFVPRNAPHHTLEGHTSASWADLMYTGTETWTPRVLDSEKEIYDHGRAGVLDLAKSAFLTPSASDAAPPPIWSTSVAGE